MSVHENFLLKKVLSAWKDYTIHLSQQGFDSELTEVEWDNKGGLYGAANSALNKLVETYPEQAIFGDEQQEEELDELSEKELEELIKKANAKIQQNKQKMEESGMAFTEIEPTDFAGISTAITDADDNPIERT